jgi:hypothetical protein
MSVGRSCSIFLAMSLMSSLAFAEGFDGSQPLECLAKSGRDCLPTESTCGPLKAESNKAPVVRIDVANKQVHSPYRTELLPISYTTTTEYSLILQGAVLNFGWSATINKKTGDMTIAIADRQGAYVIFGQCKAAGTK